MVLTPFRIILTFLPSYLFSNAAYNAIIGAQGVCMIISFGEPHLTHVRHIDHHELSTLTRGFTGAPAMVLLVTNGEHLPKSDRWNFGIFSIPIYIVSVAYSALVTIVCFVSGDSCCKFYQWDEH